MRVHRILAEGLAFPEGPVWLGPDRVAFVQIRGQCVAVYEHGRVRTVAVTGGGANGATLGADGALYVANNGGLSLGPAGPWTAAEPIARQWIEDNLGPIGRLREAGEGASEIGKVLANLPALLTQGQQTAVALNEMAKGGFRLDEDTVRAIAREEARRTRWGRVALWIGALSLAVLALLALGR